MARWFFEPGHTAAEFAVRHMMVTEVRGHFKNVKGTLDFDDRDPVRGTAEAIIDARGIWTGDPQRDAHLRSADFLDVERHPEIRYAGSVTRLLGASEYEISGDADNPRRHPPRRPRGPVPRAVEHALVGGRRGQGPEDPRRVRRDDADQPARLRRQLEQPRSTPAAWWWATTWRSPSTRRPSSSPRASAPIAAALPSLPAGLACSRGRQVHLAEQRGEARLAPEGPQQGPDVHARRVLIPCSATARSSHARAWTRSPREA